MAGVFAGGGAGCAPTYCAASGTPRPTENTIALTFICNGGSKVYLHPWNFHFFEKCLYRFFTTPKHVQVEAIDGGFPSGILASHVR